MPALGLDFGTTNSALADARDDGVRLARFAHGDGWTDTFRSVLHFAAPTRGSGGELVATAGPTALDAYLGSGEGRLLQSMKSYLADPGFESTSVFGRAMSLPQLLGRLLSSLRQQAEQDLGPLGRTLLVGRPVKF
ncbi:MAG: Hsp70 family protein, partial [Myxococcales bacterium]